jgi:hypothetical protein
MDGTGKDGLINELMIQFSPQFQVHERASTSLGGPVANLADWVVADMHNMPTNPPYIYNRHPLISEPIYAPRRKINPGLRGVWRNPPWIDTYLRFAAQHCVLVICQPPFATVADNLLRSGADAHMPGVFEAAEELYKEYETFVWHGATIRYSYLRDSKESVARTIQSKLGRRMS